MEELEAIIGSSRNSGGVRAEGGKRYRYDLCMVGRGGLVGRGGRGCRAAAETLWRAVRSAMEVC